MKHDNVISIKMPEGNVKIDLPKYNKKN